MVDMARNMIAQLMGAQRAEEDGRNILPYDDRSVCRAFLLGCCPKEILTDTRLESFFSCRKIHETAHQAEYERARETKDHFYELEAFEALGDCIRSVDYEINKVRDKIKKDTEKLIGAHDLIKGQKVKELNDQINATLVQMEKLGNEGKVYEAVELSRTINEFQQKKQDLENEIRNGQSGQQRLRVCEICGAQLSALDHTNRLANHNSGKVHIGMVKIREKYEELKKIVDERRASKQDTEKKSSDRDRKRRSRSRDNRERRRSRSRDDRERRHRSRSKSRSPRSSRSSRRHNSREHRRR